MRKFILTLLILTSLAHAQIKLDVASTVITKNQSATIYAHSDKPAILSIYDNSGRILYSITNVGTNVYKYQLPKQGIYIIILKEKETNELKKFILVLP
ncbi:MAG: T9SS type A sorting domain-containing protein [candidate division WOR-3 bacterium]|jgi:myo-inositol-hexaphosphate 3-phosphohydrolase